MSANNRLVSVWDMIQLDIGEFVGLVNYCGSTAQAFKQAVASKQGLRIMIHDRDELRGIVSRFAELSDLLNLPMGANIARMFLVDWARFENISNDGFVSIDYPHIMRVQNSIEQLANVKHEATGKMFLALDAIGNELWDSTRPHFGKVVQEAFPSASYDIEEAAKCLAVSRGTACVMHLMRATEVPLKALAAKLSVGLQNDWGSYIREIEKELAARMKAAGKRSAEEVFFAEATEAFERVKRAWRNRTMHVDAVYTVERAREIFDATRYFMAHLAPSVHE